MEVGQAARARHVQSQGWGALVLVLVFGCGQVGWGGCRDGILRSCFGLGFDAGQEESSARGIVTRAFDLCLGGPLLLCCAVLCCAMCCVQVMFYSPTDEAERVIRNADRDLDFRVAAQVQT